MVERETEVKTILVQYRCDDCGGNVVKNTDSSILLTNPPKFRHCCESCGKEYLFIQSYPYTKYVSI